jgi:hypothetical protein
MLNDTKTAYTLAAILIVVMVPVFFNFLSPSLMRQADKLERLFLTRRGLFLRANNVIDNEKSFMISRPNVNRLFRHNL